MTAKTLKTTGHIIYRGTFCRLATDTINSPVHQQMRSNFDCTIASKLGHRLMTADFDLSYLTPDYADNDDPDEPDDPDPDNDDQLRTPDIADNYILAELLLPLGKEMKCG
jgi:hypothetical protein